MLLCHTEEKKNFRDVFPGAHIKNCCVKIVYFQASNCRWEVNRRKIVCRAIVYILLLFVRSFNRSYTRRIRSTSIENSFSIVLRLLKSQIWSEIVDISGMSIKFTFWIKEVLLLFDKISSFCLHKVDRTTQSLLGGTVNVEYAPSTSSPYTHANSVHVRACARYESQRP